MRTKLFICAAFVLALTGAVYAYSARAKVDCCKLGLDCCPDGACCTALKAERPRTAAKASADCCALGLDCCPGSLCCEGSACCGAGQTCCNPPSDCCATAATKTKGCCGK